MKIHKPISLYVDATGACCLHVDGFSWSAALLQPLWALRRRLYVHAACMLASIWFLHSTVAPSLPVGVRELVGFAWFCTQVWVVGRYANRWDLQALQRRGFRLAAVEERANG